MAQTTEPVRVLGGRYALEEALGKSRTGMVWRAQDQLLRRTVTVKLVHPHLADDPEFVSALQDESRRVAALSVPAIARLLDTGEQDGVPYLVREHVPGSSARARLETGGPLSTAEAVRVTVAVLGALEEAHERGVLHCALDPDDVIVSEGGTVRLTDFGVGPAIASSCPHDAALLLGRERLAPEQLSGGTPDARTDVYGAGALLFELLTGEPPSGRTSPRGIRGDVPKAVDRIVARALDPDPDLRFPHARAFAGALHRWVEPEPEEASESDSERATGVLGWVGVPLVIVAVAVAAIAVGLWLGELEVGGPLGIRPARDTPAPVEVSFTSVLPASVDVIDPFGDGEELSSNAPMAADGDVETVWRSENYFDGELGKPGIGLVLDLGRHEEVLGLRLWTPHPGFRFQVAVGDDPEALVDSVGETITTTSLTRVPLRGAGRYVLVWITSVVPVDDGNRAEVSEVRVMIPSAAQGGAGA